MTVDEKGHVDLEHIIEEPKVENVEVVNETD